MPIINLSEQEKATLFKLTKKQEAALHAVHVALHRANRAGVWLYMNAECDLFGIDARKIKSVRDTDSVEIDGHQADRLYVPIAPSDNPNSIYTGEYLNLVGGEGITITLKTKADD